MPESPSSPDALILAAGVARELGDLVEHRPKPLLDIGGSTLLDMAIDRFANEGVARFAINVHHHAGQVLAHVAAREDADPRLRFRVSNEHDAPLGTGRGTLKALPLIETDPFLLVPLDGFWSDVTERPISRLIQRFRRNDIDVALLVAHGDRAHAGGRTHDFCLDPSGLVTTDYGAPVLSTGIALVSRTVLRDAPADPFDVETLYDKALQAGRLGGVALAGPWFEITDQSSLALARTGIGAS